MAKVTVTSSGKMNNARSRLLNGLDRGLILAGNAVAIEATNRAPIKTGRLKRAIKADTPFSSGRGRAIDIGPAGVPYGRIQEFGGLIPSHEVKPRIKKALAFNWKGENVVFKKVTIPDVRIPAQPYLRPALKAKKSKISEIILKSIVGALKGT